VGTTENGKTYQALAVQGAITEDRESAVFKFNVEAASDSGGADQVQHDIAIPAKHLPDMLGLMLRLIDSANSPEDDGQGTPSFVPTGVQTATTADGRRALVFQLPMNCKISLVLGDNLSEAIASDFSAWAASRAAPPPSDTQH